ncbi:MAG: ferrous iron transport protein B [bacterium]
MTQKRPIKIALAGQPNSGKSTIFNSLTGGAVAVGNWPGVTVEKHEGRSLYQEHEITVIDLPGTYALDSWSIDEHITRKFILTEKPDGVVAVVDASNLERNLYLVIQLLELGARVVIALNMMDIARAKGIAIDTDRLAALLGVQVVPMVASRGEGIEELRQVIHNLGRMAKPTQPLRIDYGDEIEHGLVRVIQKLPADIPSSERRWLALKLIEGESLSNDIVLNQNGVLNLATEAAAAVQTELSQRHRHDAQTAIIERRYGFIRGVLKECVRQKPEVKTSLELSAIIDTVVLNRFLGIPIFFLMMALTFFLVFRLGTPLTTILERLFALFARGIETALITIAAPEWLKSLIADGLVEGIASVLMFIPNIFILYLIIALLEDSGYMARAAFLMDRFMHAMGLHGKSFIPLLLGFGCNVPAVLAARTLESRKDRILTILAIPLISCSARLPVYILFAGIFFKRGQFWVVFSLYLLGIALAVITARLLRYLLFRQEQAPLIMELPPYHTPTVRAILRPAWLRTVLFVRRAGVVIAPAVVIIWLLGRLPWGVTEASSQSILGKIGLIAAPILKPTGFGYWWTAVALLVGIVAKEIIVSTLATIHSGHPGGLTGAIQTYFTPLSAYSFMVFTLLYFPCVATFATIRRELGWRWAGFAVTYTLIISWLTATTIYQFGKVIL